MQPLRQNAWLSSFAGLLPGISNFSLLFSYPLQGQGATKCIASGLNISLRFSYSLQGQGAIYKTSPRTGGNLQDMVI